MASRGRPKKEDIEYFPHHVNSGKTIFILEKKYKNDGYAFWFKLLELVCSSNGLIYDCNDSFDWEYLLAKTSVESEVANSILETLANLDAIDKALWLERKLIWVSNLSTNLKPLYDRRAALIPEKPILCNDKSIFCDNKSIKSNKKEFIDTENTQKNYLKGFIDTENTQKSKVKESKVNINAVAAGLNTIDEEDNDFENAKKAAATPANKCGNSEKVNSEKVNSESELVKYYLNNIQPTASRLVLEKLCSWQDIFAVEEKKR